MEASREDSYSPDSSTSGLQRHMAELERELRAVREERAVAVAAIPPVDTSKYPLAKEIDDDPINYDLKVPIVDPCGGTSDPFDLRIIMNRLCHFMVILPIPCIGILLPFYAILHGHG